MEYPQSVSALMSEGCDSLANAVVLTAIISNNVTIDFCKIDFNFIIIPPNALLGLLHQPNKKWSDVLMHQHLPELSNPLYNSGIGNIICFWHKKCRSKVSPARRASRLRYTSLGFRVFFDTKRALV